MEDSKHREIPTSSDTLGSTLHALRLNGLIYANSEFSVPWGVDMPPMAGKMMFHIVTQGGCWLRLPNHGNVYLKPGDLVLLPRGEGHAIACDEHIDCVPFFDIPVQQISQRFEFLRWGGGGDKTLLICGVMSFDHIAGQKLISQMPPLIHMSSNSSAPSRIEPLIHLMAEEAATLNAGGETVMANLADIIVIKAIRFWIEHAPAANHGWLGALKDPKIGKALSAIHARPAFAWTVERLAQEAGMSRSGFAARFTEVIGTSVRQYLTEWRMNLARLRIMHSSVTLGELAEELGYESEAAFSRAYKRVMGQSPMRARSQ